MENSAQKIDQFVDALETAEHTAPVSTPAASAPTSPTAAPRRTPTTSRPHRPAAPAATTPAFVQSRYHWKPSADHPTVRDAFAIKTLLPNGSSAVAYPALETDAPIRLFQVQLSGDPFVQHDLSRLLPPGEMAIAVCGYYPELHHDEIPHKRNIGHAGLAVGVRKKGNPSQTGVLTLNNPQTYLSGGFNNSGYGCFFFQRLEFPEGITEAEKKAYQKNIITMTAIANTFIPFAEGNFNGQDPLGIYNIDKVKEAGNQLILATYGDPEAIAWLKQGKNTAYCAELVSAGINIGANVVLTRAYIEQLQRSLAQQHGEDRYPNLYEVVKQKIESGRVLERNTNPNKAHLELGMVDPAVDLKPLCDRAPNSDRSGTGLAFMYYDFTDIAYGSIRDTYPRKDLAGLSGQALAEATEYNEGIAQIQVFAFQQIADKFKQLANLDATTSAAFDAYVQQDVLPALGKVYPSSAERNAIMKEVINKGKRFTPTGPNGEGMFIPPDLYLRPTTGWAKLTNLGISFFPEHLQQQ